MHGTWFGGLPEPRRAAILERARLKAIGEGERLYAIGDPPNGLFAVLEGGVRLANYPSPGLERLNLIVGPGDWFGEISVLDGGPRPHDAVGADTSKILHLSLAAIDVIAQSDPYFYRELALIACRHQRMQLAAMGRIVTMRPEASLAYALLHLAIAGDKHAAKDTELIAQISQESLASMVGVSRQTLSRLLKRLEAAKVIRVGYSRLTIRDRDRLVAEAQLEPDEALAIRKPWT